MRCSQAVREIRSLGGGAAPLPDLAEHLIACSACSAVLDEHQATIAAIKAVPWPMPRPEFVARSAQPNAHDGLSSIVRAHAPETSANTPHSAPADTGSGRSTTTRWRVADAVTAVALVVVLGWAFVAYQAAAPVASTQPTETPIEGATTTPRPEPTRVGDGGRLAEYRGVAGRPIEFSIGARWDVAADLNCQRVWIEFGDGASEDLHCPDDLAPDAYPGFPSFTTFRLTHRFPAGTHFPQLRMALADGSELVQSAAQVIVAAAPPRSLIAELLRLRTFPWTIVVVVLGVFWLRLRRAQDRWLGLAIATVAAGWFSWSQVLPLALPVSPAVVDVDRDDRTGSTMRAYLNGLRGQVGLDPLDPSLPLVDYTVESVQRTREFVHFVTRFTYADGSSRRYRVPLERGGSPTRRDGLGRLRTEHRQLPGIPFADLARDGIALGVPTRLDARIDGLRDAPLDPNWFDANCRGVYATLIPAHDGTAFLFAAPERMLHVPMDGGAVRDVGPRAGDYLWSPDGYTLVHSMSGLVLQYTSRGSRLEIGGDSAWRINDSPPMVRVGSNRDGVWFPRSDGVWHAAWREDQPDRMVAWPSGPSYAPAVHPCSDADGDQDCFSQASAALVRPDHSGSRIAYSCRGGLCLTDLHRNARAIVDVRVENVEWSPDGELLAAVESPPFGAYRFFDHPPDPRILWIIDREGSVRTKVTVAPEGKVLSPAWTSDSAHLLMTACPYDGRRIITVNAATGKVVDLSQPRWDAWAALMPSEDALLLSNGRGGFWRAAIVRR